MRRGYRQPALSAVVYWCVEHLCQTTSDVHSSVLRVVLSGCALLCDLKVLRFAFVIVIVHDIYVKFKISRLLVSWKSVLRLRFTNNRNIIKQSSFLRFAETWIYILQVQFHERFFCFPSIKKMCFDNYFAIWCDGAAAVGVAWKTSLGWVIFCLL